MKNKIEILFQRRDLQGILSFQQKEQIHRITCLMNKNFRSRSFKLTRQIPHTFNVFMLEDKIHNPSKCLFRFSSETRLWIKEVEMVDSVDDLKTSHSIRSFPIFEKLDGRVASALNKIIQIPTSRKRSVWRNRNLRKRTVSFAEDRPLT